MIKHSSAMEAMASCPAEMAAPVTMGPETERGCSPQITGSGTREVHSARGGQAAAGDLKPWEPDPTLHTQPLDRRLPPYQLSRSQADRISFTFSKQHWVREFPGRPSSSRRCGLTLSVQGSVQQGQKPCLPEGVAAVHQLVAAALKSSFKSHLPARHPLLRETTGKAGVNQRYSNQDQSLGHSGAPASLPSSPRATAILKQPLPRVE